NTQSTHEAGRKIRKDIAKQVGGDDHVISFRTCHQLHAHIVDDSVVHGNLRVLGCDIASGVQQGGTCLLENIGFVYQCNPLSSIRARVVEPRANNAIASAIRNPAYGVHNTQAFVAVLESRIQSLRIFANNHEVDILETRRDGARAFARPDVSVKIKMLTQLNVDTAKTLSDRRGNRTF